MNWQFFDHESMINLKNEEEIKVNIHEVVFEDLENDETNIGFIDAVDI
jgi:hypothetical protein